MEDLFSSEIMYVRVLYKKTRRNNVINPINHSLMLGPYFT